MRAIIFILFAFIVISCDRSDNEQTSSSDVIVTIGTDNITADDLTDELNKLSFRQKSMHTSTPERLNEFLQTKINEKVLYNEAVKRGYGDREEIKENLEIYKTKLLTKMFGKEIMEEIEVSEDDIKEYYQNNQDKYERIDISKIEIRFETNNEESKAEALKKAELIRKRVIEGESFEELAVELSDDPASKKREGKVGSINRGRFPDNVDQEIFQLKKDEISKPFEVQGGYLIIKANTGPDYLPYAQTERLIRSDLMNERLINYINGLRAQWEVKIYEDRLQEISKSESNKKQSN